MTVFNRGGERLPLEYNIDTVQQTDPTARQPDAQIIRNYVNSIHSFTKNRRNTLVPENLVVSNNLDALDKVAINGGMTVGIGVALDTISNVGLDFRNTNFVFHGFCYVFFTPRPW